MDDHAQRDEVRRLNERFRLLSSTTCAFAEAAVDYRRLLETIAKSLTEVVKDGCVLSVVSDDGSVLEPVSVHAHDERSIEQLSEIMACAPFRLDEKSFTISVLHSGVPGMIPKIDYEEFAKASTPYYVASLQELGAHSLLFVPLRLEGRPIGMLALVRYRDSSPAYDEGDRELAKILADHAALSIANSRLITQRREAEARFQRLSDAGILGVLVTDLSGRVTEINDALLRMVGYRREEVIDGKLNWLSLTAPGFEEVDDRARKQIVATGVADLREKDYVRKDGARLPAMVGSALLEGGDGRLISFVLDLSERRRAQEERAKLEAHLRQTQKMEAVGRLAGGVAHDFNNLLSVILSYCDLLLGDLKPDDSVAADVREIREAGNRAAALTRQLLAFSRQEVIERKVIDPAALVMNMQNMLQRLLGEDIDLVMEAKPGVGMVHADPTSLEQVVLNLAVNARDAMAVGGKLTIEITNVTVDEKLARDHLSVRPGPYVMLAVTDTGTGMSEETMSHLFEPFFTTKEKGKGTGLGLSTVFGVVNQNGGGVWVYSELGRGSTFKVYLPRVEAQVKAEQAGKQPLTRGGGETILLVEDNDQLRAVARGILVRRGYEIVEARNGADAMVASEAHAGLIHLVLTDVVMPLVSGPELVARLVAKRPGIKVLYMSGYTDDSVVRHGMLDDGAAYIQKPITPDMLARRVREVLDGGAAT